MHNPGELEDLQFLWHSGRLEVSPLRCRSSCTFPGSPSPCWSSLRDCSSECLFLPVGYLTGYSSWSWTECGLCTEIHRCCWDLCSTYKTEEKISHHYCVVYIDVPFKHQGLEISMTTFETLVLAGAFLSNHKSCQESEEEGDDGCAQTGD